LELLIGGWKPTGREFAHSTAELLVGVTGAEQVTDVGEREAGTLRRADHLEAPDVFGAVPTLTGQSIGLWEDADRFVVPDR